MSWLKRKASLVLADLIQNLVQNAVLWKHMGCYAVKSYAYGVMLLGKGPKLNTSVYSHHVRMHTHM